MNHSKYRVFLKTCDGKLKKIYSIEKISSKTKKEIFFLVKVCSTIMCNEFGLPPNSEIHYHYTFNGKDSHLSLKYNDKGPFSNHLISFVENYLKLQFGDKTYKHKQVVIMNDGYKITSTHLVTLTQDNKLKYIIPGYSPPAFSDYSNHNTVFFLVQLVFLRLAINMREIKLKLQ